MDCRPLQGSKMSHIMCSSCITTAMYEIDGSGYHLQPIQHAVMYVCTYACTSVSLDACHSQSTDINFLYSLASQPAAVCTSHTADKAAKLAPQCSLYTVYGESQVPPESLDIKGQESCIRQ